jgi:hypothetical protein
MTKKEMSVRIASALLNTTVTEDHFKVAELMKWKKSDLSANMMLVDKILKTGDENGGLHG